MADTRAASGLTVQQWDDKFHTEYYQENLFSPLYGTGEMSPIQVREDLTKKAGDSITFAFLQSLNQDAVTGSSVMEGNEEDLGSRSFRMYIDKRRNAVRISEMEEQKSAIGLRDAAKPALKEWAEKDTRDLIIQALGSINGVAYTSASEAQKDAWLVDNSDRVLFGALLSNNSSNDHSASLANVDTTADKLTRTNLRLLKRVALNARNPRIKPVKDPGNGKRYFLAFAHPNQMRDLYDSMDATLQATSVQAQASKIFEGGDQHGVAIDGIFGIAKLRFGTGSGDTDDTKDHGVATGYFTSAADA
jgi:N4-gp56 family major capsid protein